MCVHLKTWKTYLLGITANLRSRRASLSHCITMQKTWRLMSLKRKTIRRVMMSRTRYDKVQLQYLLIHLEQYLLTRQVHLAVASKHKEKHLSSQSSNQDLWVMYVLVSLKRDKVNFQSWLINSKLLQTLKMITRETILLSNLQKQQNLKSQRSLLIQQ